MPSKPRFGRLASAALLAGAVLCVAAAAAAEPKSDPFRVQGYATPAHALGEPQQSELSWGAGVAAVGEYVISPKLSAGLKLGFVWLGQGSDPTEPGVKPEGEAAAYTGAVEVTSYPLAKGVDGVSFSTEGIFLSASAGGATTGGRLRPAFDVFAGWDVIFPIESLGVGPTVGVLHVFQPNGSVRPDDANVLMLGIHGRWWPQPSRPPKVAKDRDRDGILDEADKCPDAPEDFDTFEDQDGCPDVDNDQDGVPDRSDQCPLQPEDKDGFQDDDGCPDQDNDGDGIPDTTDKCPNELEDLDAFEQEDGCPDTDNDKDGIPDAQDLCPNEPENFNGYADGDGCPDEDQVRVVGGKIVLDERVHFPLNTAVIEPSSFPLLERLAKLLREHPEYTHISVEGHADERGNEELNQRLSHDRAQAVLEFLVSKGVDRSRLSFVGYGSTRPLVKGTDERAYYQNRRVEFVVTRAGATPGKPTPAPRAPEVKP
jgi:outer membrane protein OmpA-like peptidoglycan-associated protein